MQRLFLWVFGVVLLVSCASGDPAQKELTSSSAPAVEQQVSVDTHAARVAEPMNELPLPKPATIQAPQGIYELSNAGQPGTAHMIQFVSNQGFRMQYVESNDSVRVVEGTWAPSNGFIWIYRNNVAWGRYRWKGDVLQYFSPVSGKSFAMQKRPGILENKAWQNKPAEGLRIFGIGNEPFWSVGLTSTDSLQFLLADKGQPVNVPVREQLRKGDSLIYEGQNDSAVIRLVLLRRFCQDGMSDHVYPEQVTLQINGQVYKGCGVKYR
jgi:uncharacterized membrane protein